MKVQSRSHVSLIASLFCFALLFAGTWSNAHGQERTPNPDRSTVIGNISKANLQTKLPGAIITELGTDRLTGNKIYEVKGGPENMEDLLSRDTQITHVSRHGSVSKQQLAAMENFIASSLLYHGNLTYGSDFSRPGQPFPKTNMCWVCTACSEPLPPPLLPPGLLPDCPKPDNLDSLYDEWAKWAALTQVLTDLLDTYNFYDYWRSAGGMVKDMVSAAGLLLPGAGTVLSRGINMLLDMAVSGALDAMMSEMLDQLGLENLNSRGAISAALSEANSSRVDAHQAYQAVLTAWINCKNNVNLKNVTLQADLDAWSAVRDQYLKDWEAYQNCLNSPTRCSYQAC